ncbi:MAG: cation:proton antiporter [Acidobacteriota bacterium]
MTLFESTLALLIVAIVLLQVSRRLGTPYPAMLALAGACVAAFPWAPNLVIEPNLALTLFVAPVLLDAAYDTAPRELRRNWVPLVALVLVAVVLTTAAVAWAGWAMAGLPLAAAITLGAIVAPPDAAAAAAVLNQFSLPRRTLSILQGESLLNDAVALLIFGAAVSAATSQQSAVAKSFPTLLIAIPGGVVFGLLLGKLYPWLASHVAGTLSSSILEFTTTFGAWIIAEHLHLSPIITIVVFAMTIARSMPARQSPRDRIHSYSVWEAVVFILNVLAFLLMGLQARIILSRLAGDELWRALLFACVVLAIVILVRLGWVMAYSAIVRWLGPPNVSAPTKSIALLVSWCGMRGLVTLATAYALPQGFPGRDVIVLSAFTVVLGTLIIQGLTIKPLIKLLQIKPDTSLEAEISIARTEMMQAAIATLADEQGETANNVRAEYEAARALAKDRSDPQADTEHDRLRRKAIAAQRKALAEIRADGRIDDDAFHRLEEELDWAELNASHPRHLELLST